MSTQNKPQPQKSDNDIRARVAAAKTSLGLKDLNVAAAVAGHKMYQAHAAKNPNMPVAQVLNKISPNARANYLKLSSRLPTDMLSDRVPMNQFRGAVQKLKQAQGSMKLNNSFDVVDFLD
jgi:hypothetical protein